MVPVGSASCGCSPRRLAACLLVVSILCLSGAAASNRDEKSSSRSLHSIIRKSSLPRQSRGTVLTPQVSQSLPVHRQRLLQKKGKKEKKGEERDPEADLFDALPESRESRRRQRRPRQPRMGKGGGMSKGEDMGKGGKGGIDDEDMIVGKGGGKGGKGGKGGGKGGKGYGMMSGKGYGMMGGKGSKSGSGNVCDDFDLEDVISGGGKGGSKGFGMGGMGGGKGGKGGKGQRKLARSLQVDSCASGSNVLETAKKNPELSIFVDLIEFLGLEEVFECIPQLTTLAPSNAAFNENPGLLESFYEQYDNEPVREMILYHLVPDMLLSSDFEQGPLESLLGDDIDVGLDPLMFNQALVTAANITACNGVIHIIDDILIPPGKLESARMRSYSDSCSETNISTGRRSTYHVPFPSCRRQPDSSRYL
jgi:uncharacterized surface protein with fasciclin (FAS1) repeats